MNFINLDQTNIDKEHICCAISDKKCKESYEMKKKWLKKEFENGYKFYRIDERAKVFIEYGPAEKAWMPITAPNYFAIGCFWVSGQYKGKGHGKALLAQAIDDARKEGRDGLVTIVGTKKFHFMSDTKWLLSQGFEIADTTPAGFSLLVLKLTDSGAKPQFTPAAKEGTCPDKDGYVIYYSNRCPFTDYHITESLKETAAKRNLNIKVIKLTSAAEAQSCPAPATIFSLFHNGKFLTTDLSSCMDSRFDKITGYSS
ncbi:MAG: GNAT family N-acetyltransferase [Spirochaetales bacterium]|nr:GNAT family N-acetyltransferase [Spirochaetales bacterium]